MTDPKPVVVLVTGDRNWDNRERLWQVLDSLPVELLVQGGATGADRCAQLWANDRFINSVEYPARWDVYGRAAGPVRNQEMLDKEHPDLVVAFHDDFEHSRGTADMVRRARKAGIPTRLFTSNGEVTLG